MSPNGRRAWREWVRRQDLRRKHKQPKGSVCRMARQARRHIPLVPGVMLPKFITARSLVGMTMGGRKRIRRTITKLLAKMHGNLASLGHQHEAARDDSFLRIGERLRPCPGCCACWGADVSPADFGYDAECFGPRVAGRTKREISRMWQWQRALVDDCDGSGVLPARRS